MPISTFPNIANTTDTEEMDWAIATQRLHRIAYHVVHLVFLRAEATADRVVTKKGRTKRIRPFPAQFFIDAADTIKRLAALWPRSNSARLRSARRLVNASDPPYISGRRDKACIRPGRQ